MKDLESKDSEIKKKGYKNEVIDGEVVSPMGLSMNL